MTLDEMRAAALARVKQDNPSCTDFTTEKTYENIMDGTVFAIAFKKPDGTKDTNHVYFRGKEERVLRWHSDVIAAVAAYRERNWFFRFIELAGLNGVLAFILLLIFSLLLVALAILNPSGSNATIASILEIVKLTFTLILGYFFGSQSVSRKVA
jgi:hypothetical protein